MLRLDMKRFCADLMLTTGSHEIEQGVPFFAIEPAAAVKKAGDNSRADSTQAESETAAT